MEQSALLDSGKSMGRGEAVVGTVVLSLLLFSPVLGMLLKPGARLCDPDVWWHLRAGEWMVEHGTWIRVDSFSASANGKPWVAYSWLPELLLYGFHRAFGLRGLVMYSAVLSVGIIVPFHALMRRLQPNVLFSGVLTLAAVGGLGPLTTPRPWLLGILCFVMELYLLVTASHTGHYRRLLWLVPLFWLWANSHTQFVLGLGILGLWSAEAVAARMAPTQAVDDGWLHSAPAGWMALVFALCVGATLINPYHYHLYTTVAALAGQLSGLEDYISEFTAMGFRSLSDWIVLGVTVGAAAAIGMQRRVRLVWGMTFLLAAYCSFHAKRDSWFVLLVGLTILAEAGPKLGTGTAPLPAWSKWAVGGIMVLLLGIGLGRVRQAVLEEEIGKTFPAKAVEFVKGKECAGPLYNSFDCGGYLIFNLRRFPVSIDGRGLVHGTDRITKHCEMLRGRDGWKDDAELGQAKLFILERKFALSKLLRFDERFAVVYEDKIAVVLVAR